MRTARQWMVDGKHRFASCPITQGTLVRARLRAGGSAESAKRALTALLGHPRHEFWVDNLSYPRSAPRRGGRGPAGDRRVPRAFGPHPRGPAGNAGSRVGGGARRCRHADPDQPTLTHDGPEARPTGLLRISRIVSPPLGHRRPADRTNAVCSPRLLGARGEPDPADAGGVVRRCHGRAGSAEQDRARGMDGSRTGQHEDQRSPVPSHVGIGNSDAIRRWTYPVYGGLRPRQPLQGRWHSHPRAAGCVT